MIAMESDTHPACRWQPLQALQKSADIGASREASSANSAAPALVAEGVGGGKRDDQFAKGGRVPPKLTSGL